MLKLFDCNCMIGRCSDIGTALQTANDLLSEMAHHNITKALVSHTFFWDFEIAFGNEMLLREVEGKPNLYPVITVCPWATNREMWSDETMAILRKQAFGIRLFPVRHHFDLSEANLGVVLQFGSTARLPVLIDYDQVNNFGGFKALLERYPDVPFILAKVGLEKNRYLYPLLSKHKNLHIEISLYREYRGVESLVEHFGPDQVLFGSCLPFLDAGASAFRVVYASLTQEDKTKLAYQNMERLIANVRS